MKKAIKLICIIMIIAMISAMFIACDNTKDPSNDDPVGTTSDLPDAPSGAITELDGNKALVSDGYTLVIDMTNGVSIKDATGANMFYSKTPAQVKVRGKGMGIGVETYTEKTYSAMYSEVEQDTYGYECSGVVITAAGSEFEVIDRYYIVADGQFGIDRKVNVLKAKTADVGFASIVSFINASNSDYYDDFDYFIPSILYKDASNVVSGAIASNLDLDKMYVKETRTGLPMVMAFHSEQKYGLALAHISPEISVGTSVGGGSKGDVNDELQYGAIGLTIKPYVSVDFVYPCTEGPTTYDSGSGMIARYHTVKENNSHTYKVGLVPCNEDTYTDAMVETYQNVYSSEDHYLADIDMTEVYEQNIEVFSDTYKEYTYNGEVVAAGLPWSLALPTGEAGQGYTFQMGFVGQQLPAVKDFNLEIADKEFVVFVGPSGCGKSTTLRMVAGLEEISEGEIYIDDKLVNDEEPKDRDIAMVFQNYALYPHMTVYDNMAFGLKLKRIDDVKKDKAGNVVLDKEGNPKIVHRKYTKKEIDEKVKEAASVLEITEYLDRKPKALSGGQRQRVAIGRAIVRKPKVFLMDEPLSNLDAKLRHQMRSEIILLRKRINTTFIYVTHDQVEAMTLGDRIVIMKDGVIQQVGTPVEVFNHPLNLFVAGFIGSPKMNFINAELNSNYSITIAGKTIMPSENIVSALKNKEVQPQNVVLGIRPEHIALSDDKDAFTANVVVGEMMGSEYHLHVELEGEPMIICVPTLGLSEKNRNAICENGTISFKFDNSAIHLFNKDDEYNLI